MAKIQMEVPEKLIQEAAGEKIKKLENDLRKALIREERAKQKIKDYDNIVNEAHKVIGIFRAAIEDVKWDTEFENLFNDGGWA